MISIIVCNHNYSQFIPALMQAYNKYPFGKDEVEMVIVDDNSTADNFLRYLRLSIILIEPWFKVRAFEAHKQVTYNNVLADNIGVKKCSGDIIILNPVDVIPLGNVLPVICEEHQKITNLCLYPQFWLSLTGYVEGFDKWQVTTCGLSMRKESYYLLGGQDEKYIGHCSSDVNFVRRIEKGPFIFKKDDRLLYVHLHDVFQNPVVEGVEPPLEKEWKANPNGWGELDTLEEINISKLLGK